jgi:pimeloyl-ACP methyl ester carboxylesterase
MRRYVVGAAVALGLLSAVSAAHARTPLAVTGGRIALETVCGEPHGVHVTAEAARVTVHVAANERLRLARCAGTGHWARAAKLGPPGDYRLTLGHQRRFVRVLDAVTEMPVTFRVMNVNRSLAPCTSDGKVYELRGTLAAPAAAVEAGRLPAVTLVLHEFGFGSWFWHFTDVAGYDTIGELAARGHAAVAIDRLGYAPSAKPNGNATCLGAQADMAHQVVGQLRAGSYGASRPVPADAVALAGHSVGGAVAELEASSFADVKALAAVEQGGVCARKAGEPDDYAYFTTSRAQFDMFDFHDADPAVESAAYARRHPDPCGDSTSQLNVIAVNNAHDGSLTVPVLLLFGADDPVFQPDAPDKQAKMYSSSPSVKLVRVPRAAHALTLEHSAPILRDALATWMQANGL